MLITAKLNLTKLGEAIKSGDAKVFHGKSDYLDITICDYPDGGQDRFGNTHYICISQSKEDREAGRPRTYIGEGKANFITRDVLKKRETPVEEVTAPQQTTIKPTAFIGKKQVDVDDLPF
jgi:hypothetical protein